MDIYKITNLANNKIYIGKALDYKCRFKDHLNNALKGFDSYLYNAIRFYGIEQFIIEKIDEADNNNDLNKLEKYWIKYYNSTDPNIGYNLTDGGDGGNTIKYLSEEKKEQRLNKISTTKANKSEEEKKELHDKLSVRSHNVWVKKYESGYINNNKGTKWYNNGSINIMAKEKPEGFTEGRIKSEKLLNGVNAMNKNNKKYYNNGFNEIKCSDDEVPEGYIKGKLKKIRIYTNVSDETKNKISNSVKELWKDPIYREHMINAHKGKGYSESAKEKQRKKMLGTKIVNRDGHEKRIHEDELEKYLSEGWRIGFTDEHKRKNGNRHRKTK